MYVRLHILLCTRSPSLLEEILDRDAMPINYKHSNKTVDFPSTDENSKDCWCHTLTVVDDDRPTKGRRPKLAKECITSNSCSCLNGLFSNSAVNYEHGETTIGRRPTED